MQQINEMLQFNSNFLIFLNKHYKEQPRPYAGNTLYIVLLLILTGHDKYRCCHQANEK